VPRVATSYPDPNPFARTDSERVAFMVHRAHVLRTHRVCDAKDQPFVSSACLYDRGVLPRRHQADRGTRNASRGIHRQAPAGAYCGIRPWDGRQHWLAFIVPIAISMNTQILKQEELSAETLLIWARVESGYAQDQRTGRRCIVRPDTVASVMGVHKKTVSRCRRVARKLGIQVVIELGRMLTLDESTRARRAGSCQRGLSTETALTVPSPVAFVLLSATPTRGKATTSKGHLESSPLKNATTKRTETAPPPRQPKRSPRTCPARTLAGELVKKVPWLRSERPGRLAPALNRFATSRPTWTAQDVIDAIQAIRDRRGLVTALTEDQIRTRPAVVLAAFLRELDPHDDHPRLALVDPAELRCDRPECDHGWITIDEALAGHPLVHRCDQCRPGAWPAPNAEDDYLAELEHNDEPPF
jgi:hypothetical protein